MGSNTSTFCSCLENQKATEHYIADSFAKKSNSNSSINMKKDSNASEYELGKKTKVGYINGISNAETGDAVVDTFIVGIKQNEEVMYEGETKNGKRNGKGVLKNSEGKLFYEGLFKDDLFHGEGTWVLEGGFTYTGSFFNGKRNGKGVLFSNDDRYRYEGYWVDDLKSGNGTETYPDGSSFEGEFVNNRKNGQGLFYINDKSTYVGEFKDDKLDGFGKFIWSEDKIYEGQWKNNFIEGFGIFIKQDKVYIGNFSQDRKSGQGFYLLNNGNILVGNFESGEIEGLTIIIPKQGDQQLCLMSKSKVLVLINDENEKNNIKIGTEYKKLNDFFENNKNLVKKFVKEQV